MSVTSTLMSVTSLALPSSNRAPRSSEILMFVYKNRPNNAVMPRQTVLIVMQPHLIVLKSADQQ